MIGHCCAFTLNGKERRMYWGWGGMKQQKQRLKSFKGFPPWDRATIKHIEWKTRFLFSLFKNLYITNSSSLFQDLGTALNAGVSKKPFSLLVNTSFSLATSAPAQAPGSCSSKQRTLYSLLLGCNYPVPTDFSRTWSLAFFRELNF